MSNHVTASMSEMLSDQLIQIKYTTIVYIIVSSVRRVMRRKKAPKCRSDSNKTFTNFSVFQAATYEKSVKDRDSGLFWGCLF